MHLGYFMVMNHQEITVYQAGDRRKLSMFAFLKLMFKNLSDSRELIWVLFKRDFLMSYKRSFLGLTWLFVAPVFGIVSWLFMNATGLLNPGHVNVPYPVFVLMGTSIWTLFSGFYSSSSGTLSAGAGFIQQVKFSHEALLAKQTLQHLANFGINLIINIIVILAFRVSLSWGALLFPIIIVPLFCFGAGLGLIMSVVEVVALDLKKFFDMSFNLLPFATPVFYSENGRSALLATVIRYNPLTYIFNGIRDCVLFGRIEHVKVFSIVWICSVLFFCLAWRVFFATEDKVIERII
jgi:ABC-type polysaccharide/polyol phosphate export permease